MTTEQRIARLETTVATWKRAAIGIAAVCVCIVGMGQAPSQNNDQQAPTTMKLNQLTLTDKDGNVALIISGEGKGMASFTYPAHKGQLKVVIDEDQTMFSVENGSGLAVLAGTTKESANVSLVDAKVEGRFRILLDAVRPENNKPMTAGIAITDKYGDVTWKQTVK